MTDSCYSENYQEGPDSLSERSGSEPGACLGRERTLTDALPGSTEKTCSPSRRAMFTFGLNAA
jgi:hypothetical protein